MNKSSYKLSSIEIYILFLLSVYLLRTIGAYNLLPTKIDSLIFAVAGLVGGILFLVQLFKIFIQRKFKYYDWVIVAFLAILFLSIIVNYKYSLIGNIKGLAWQTIFLLMIYSTVFHDFKNELFFDIFRKIIIIFGFVMSSISLCMFITRFSYVTTFDSRQNPLRIGFVENRLFGSYTDPNYAAVMSVVIISLTLYYLLSHKPIKRISKIFYICNIIVQLIYIGLSGSRNGLIVLALTTLVFSFFKFFYYKRVVSQKIISRFLLSLIIGIFFSGLSVVIVSQSKNTLAQLPPITIFDETKVFKKENDVKLNNPKKPISLKRKDVSESSDISNLRFTIWESAFEIFKKNPLLGIPPKSIHQYAQANMPDTYLARTKLAVHNAYINVLVSTGLFGTICLIIFIGKVIMDSLKMVFSKNVFSDSYYGYHLLAILALFLSGFFHNEMFLMSTSSALIFWVFLGSIQAQNTTKKGNEN